MALLTVFRIWIATALVLLTLALPLTAQSTPDFEAWSTVAERAELTIENGRASTSALETLRQNISDWRQQFLAAQSINSDRIATVEAQIATLGTPAEGETESADIAARRAELNEQLQRLRAPIVAAEEAHSRAEGLIREIDTIIRERQTDELLQGGPSPLNPVYWTPAIEAVGSSFRALTSEVRGSFGSEAQRRTAVRDLPEVLLYALLGLVLLLRGRRWAQRGADMLHRRAGRGSRIWRFVATLGKIFFPYLGVSLLITAVFETSLPGLRATLILDNIPLYALGFLSIWWVAERVFSRDDSEMLIAMSPVNRAEIRWYAMALALVAIIAHVLSVLADYDNYEAATRAVIGFPLIVFASLMLFRLGSLLRKEMIEPEDGDTLGLYRVRVTRILGRIAQIVAIVGPLVAAAGYGNAAVRLVSPTVASLAVFALLLVLQQFFRALYHFIRRKDDDEESLIPVLINFALILVALPVLALIWGARTADLSELWTTFQEGFSIGDSRISPIDFLTFVMIFTVGYMATRLLQGAMRTSVLPRTKLDAGGRNAITSGIGYVGIFLAALIAISSAGIDLSSLAIVAGALSVGIGFGLQNIVSNFVSGIILLIERPIAEGDWIEVGGKMGYVRGISVRSTRIETFDRTDVIVPNADLVSGMVTNWTRGKTVGRVIVPVGVAYGNDTRKVEKILLSIAREHPMVLLNPEPSIVFQGFGADSLDFEIRAILRDVNYVLSVKSDMNHEIAKRFAEGGIEIPFAQRDIWLRNPEALAEAAIGTPVEGGTNDEDETGEEASI